MMFPTITEVVDESVLLEQNDSVEMIDQQKSGKTRRSFHMTNC